MADTYIKILGKSIVADAAGMPITSTIFGAKRALDVNVTGGDIIIDNPTIVVDIDAFGASPDSVLIVGSQDGTTTGTRHVLEITTAGNLRTDSSDTIQPVSATDLDIRDLSSATDSVAAVQSGIWNITDISGTVSLPTGAATLAEQQVQSTSLSIIDDWDESDRAKINAIVGQAGVQAGSGAISANTQRVVIATDQPVIPVSDNAGSLTIDQATAANLNAQVVGNIADNAADSGNPVKAGAIFNSTAQTYDTGDRSNLQSDSTGSLFVNASGRKPTYSASATFTLAATPTDVFTLTGSASKTVRIRNITMTGTNTGNTNALIGLIKRSAANTGGTSAAVTRVPHDSANAAATATVLSYTANPTLGAAVGVMGYVHGFFPTLASTNVTQFREAITFSPITEPITLRGTSEVLAVNLGGATITGTTIVALKIEWTEE